MGEWAGKAIRLTGPGVGAVAVVRLAGKGVERFLRRHFSRPVAEGRCVHGVMRDGEEILDDPLVVRVDAERADVNLHGGPWGVEAFLQLAAREGFEIVREIQDWPEEALDSQEELERQVERWIPEARTELALGALLAQPEAWMRGDPREADEALYWLLNPPRVVIAGKPNVGKSTLANQLFAQERSIVADRAGTTRDWVGEMADIHGLAVMLIDTPGLRHTEDLIEREAIAGSRQLIRQADLVIHVVEAQAAEGEEPDPPQPGRKGTIRVVNKIDLCPGLPGGGIRIAANKGEGIDDLKAEILRTFGCWQLDPNEPRWWTQGQRENAAKTGT